MRFGQFSATDLSEEVIVAMRQLSRYRLALVDSCGDCKRRVIALLDQVFPEYDSLFSDTFGVTSKEVLSKYPTPEDMLTVSTLKLTNLLEKASRGRFGREKAEQLKSAAASSFGVSFAKDAFAFQISIRRVSELRLSQAFLFFLSVIVLEIRQYSCVLCLDKEQKLNG